MLIDSYVRANTWQGRRKAGRMGRVGQVILPRNLVAAAEAEGRQGWLATTLPAALGQALQMWSLRVGEPFQSGGQTAWVAPAWDASGAELVLKIGWPHADAAHEADGLRAWAGNGGPGTPGPRPGPGRYCAVPRASGHRDQPGPALHRPARRRHAGRRARAMAGIDPKPYVGDPAYDPLQHMLDCDERLRSDPRPGQADGRPSRPRPPPRAALAVRPLRAGVAGMAVARGGGEVRRALGAAG